MLKKNKAIKSPLHRSRPSLMETLLAAPKLPLHEWRLIFGNRKATLPTTHFKRWQLQDAKAKFSALFDEATENGPQVVTRRNKEAVVVISQADYAKLVEGSGTPPPDMLQTLLKCPKGPDLPIDRDESYSVLDLPRIFD